MKIPVGIISASAMEDELQKKTNLEIPTRTNGESTDKTPSITAEPVPMSVASTLRDIEMEVTENSDEGKGKIENEATKPEWDHCDLCVFCCVFIGIIFLRNSILIVKPSKAIFHTDIFRLFLVSY